MQPSFAQQLGSIARFIGSLVLTAIVGLLAWFFYQQHLDQQQYKRIVATGHPVTVTITEASLDQRTWTDAFLNVAYLSFRYQQKDYTIRYKQDSIWLSPGDRIALYYSAAADAFRQPKAYATVPDNRRQSRLIGYTFLNSWNTDRKWGLATIALVALFVMLLCGLLATITHLEFLRTAGRLIFLALLLAGAAYLIYNTWRYYQYFNQVKKGALEETVRVVSTGRHAVSRRSSWWYTYEATILHHQQERVIPIEEAEYDRLKAGDPLQVYYNPRLNDMMSVNHTPEHTNLLAALFVGLLLAYFGWQQVKKIRHHRTT